MWYLNHKFQIIWIFGYLIIYILSGIFTNEIFDKESSIWRLIDVIDQEKLDQYQAYVQKCKSKYEMILSSGTLKTRSSFEIDLKKYRYGIDIQFLILLDKIRPKYQNERPINFLVLKNTINSGGNLLGVFVLPNNKIRVTIQQSFQSSSIISEYRIPYNRWNLINIKISPIQVELLLNNRPFETVKSTNIVNWTSFNQIILFDTSFNSDDDIQKQIKFSDLTITNSKNEIRSRKSCLLQSNYNENIDPFKNSFIRQFFLCKSRIYETTLLPAINKVYPIKFRADGEDFLTGIVLSFYLKPQKESDGGGIIFKLGNNNPQLFVSFNNYIQLHFINYYQNVRYNFNYFTKLKYNRWNLIKIQIDSQWISVSINCADPIISDNTIFQDWSKMNKLYLSPIVDNDLKLFKGLISQIKMKRINSQKSKCFLNQCFLNEELMNNINDEEGRGVKLKKGDVTQSKNTEYTPVTHNLVSRAKMRFSTKLERKSYTSTSSTKITASTTNAITEATSAKRSTKEASTMMKSTEATSTKRSTKEVSTMKKSTEATSTKSSIKKVSTTRKSTEATSTKSSIKKVSTTRKSTEATSTKISTKEASTTKKSTEETSTIRSTKEASTMKKSTEATLTKRSIKEASTTKKYTEPTSSNRPTKETSTIKKSTEETSTIRSTKEASTMKKSTEATSTNRPTKEASTMKKSTEETSTIRSTKEASTTKKSTEEFTTKQSTKKVFRARKTTKKLSIISPSSFGVQITKQIEISSQNTEEESNPTSSSFSQIDLLSINSAHLRTFIRCNSRNIPVLSLRKLTNSIRPFGRITKSFMTGFQISFYIHINSLFIPSSSSSSSSSSSFVQLFKLFTVHKDSSISVHITNRRQIQLYTVQYHSQLYKLPVLSNSTILNNKWNKVTLTFKYDLVSMHINCKEIVTLSNVYFTNWADLYFLDLSQRSYYKGVIRLSSMYLRNIDYVPNEQLNKCNWDRCYLRKKKKRRMKEDVYENGIMRRFNVKYRRCKNRGFIEIVRRPYNFNGNWMRLPQLNYKQGIILEFVVFVISRNDFLFNLKSKEDTVKLKVTKFPILQFVNHYQYFELKFESLKIPLRRWIQLRIEISIAQIQMIINCREYQQIDNSYIRDPTIFHSLQLFPRYSKVSIADLKVSGSPLPKCILNRCFVKEQSYRQVIPEDPIKETTPTSTKITTTVSSKGRTTFKSMKSRVTIQGPKGDRGDKGVKGQKGDKGDSGFRGYPGKKGQRGSMMWSEKGAIGRQGIPGEEGPKGFKGLAGKKGFKGLPGVTGTPGEQGKPGLKGDKGMYGLPGLKGAKGNPGSPGVSKSGEKGVKGNKGEKGQKGDKGAIGMKGEMGDPGLPGASGRKGVKGKMGESPPGLVGIKGKKGKPGIPGDKGLTGQKGKPVIGRKGEKGETGEPGQPGQGGVKGKPGLKGNKGKKGRAGLSGKDGSIGIKGLPGLQGENGEKGNTGSNGMVKGIKGKSGKPGPRGLKGESGSRGKPGIKGSRGDRGSESKGKLGIKGVKGEIGNKGNRGEKGDKGNRGKEGTRGIKGVFGESGDTITGEKGEKGIKGDPGIIGEKGEKGSKGFIGMAGLPGSPGKPGIDGIVGKHGDRGDIGNRGKRGKVGNVIFERLYLYQLENVSQSLKDLYLNNKYSLNLNLIKRDIVNRIQLKMMNISNYRNYRDGRSQERAVASCGDLKVGSERALEIAPHGILWVDPNEGSTKDAILAECRSTTTNNFRTLYFLRRQGGGFNNRDVKKERSSSKKNDMMTCFKSLHESGDLLTYFEPYESSNLWQSQLLVDGLSLYPPNIINGYPIRSQIKVIQMKTGYAEQVIEFMCEKSIVYADIRQPQSNIYKNAIGIKLYDGTQLDLNQGTKLGPEYGFIDKRLFEWKNNMNITEAKINITILFDDCKYYTAGTVTKIMISTDKSDLLPMVDFKLRCFDENKKCTIGANIYPVCFL